jgi:hypothetical protein
MNNPLPDTSSWRPRAPNSSLAIPQALAARCRSAEEAICQRSFAERVSSIDGFDSGAATEDIVRDSIRNLLPMRYHTTAGSVVDSLGCTAGDVDVVIFNSHWFPEVHAPATKSTRRRLLPYEGVYAVGEVKQTLTLRSLDEAMEKLVKCHRLSRSATPRSRLVENRDIVSRESGLSNPLYSFIVGVTTTENIQHVLERFYEINRSLKRLEVVRALCVLNQGSVVWATTDSEGVVRPALFMSKDLLHPIVPAYFPTSTQGGAFYTLVENLLLHLFHSVLSPEDVVSRYGAAALGKVKVPDSPSIQLPPDDNA